MMAQQSMLGKIPVAGPLRLEVLFLFPRPKRIQRPELANDHIPHAQKPDFDNVAKAVCDSFTGVVWLDDGQVSTAYVRKRFATATEAPGVLVRVYYDRIPWK